MCALAKIVVTMACIYFVKVTAARDFILVDIFGYFRCHENVDTIYSLPVMEKLRYCHILIPSNTNFQATLHVDELNS